jgi:hypothetical protein
MTTEDDLKGRGWVIVNETNADGWCDWPGDGVASFSSDDDQWSIKNQTNESPNTTCVFSTRYEAFSELRISLNNISSTTVGSGNDKKYLALGKDDSASRNSTIHPAFQTLRGHRGKVSGRPALGEYVHGPRILPNQQSNVEASKPNSQPAENSLPRSMNDLLSQSNLTQLFPYLDSDKVEEWLQKCKTARDNTYIGEEVRVSIVQDYDSFPKATQTQHVNPQNASKDAEFRQNQNRKDAFQPDNSI